MKFVYLLIFLMTFSFAQGAVMNESIPVEFHYRNISGFHKNGEALWIGKNLIVVQILGRAPCIGKNCIYRLQVNDAEMSVLLKKLIELGSDPNQVKEIKLNRTDPVQVKFVVRNGEKIINYHFWDHDWDQQPKKLQDLKKVINDIFEMAKKSKPLSEEKIQRSDISFWPKEFIPLK